MNNVRRWVEIRGYESHATSIEDPKIQRLPQENQTIGEDWGRKKPDQQMTATNANYQAEDETESPSPRPLLYDVSLDELGNLG